MSLFKYEQNMFCARCESIGNSTGFRLQVLCGTSGRPRISLHVFSLHFPRLHVADSFLCQAEVASMKHQQTLGSVVDMLYRGLWCRWSSMNKTCFVRGARALATPLGLDFKFCVVLLADPECSHIPRLDVPDSSLCQAISQAEVASMKHQQPLGSVVDILCFLAEIPPHRPVKMPIIRLLRNCRERLEAQKSLLLWIWGKLW